MAPADYITPYPFIINKNGLNWKEDLMNKILIAVVCFVVVFAFSAFQLTYGGGREDIRSTKSHERFQIPVRVLKDRLSLHLYRDNQRKASFRWESARTFQKMIQNVRHDRKGSATSIWHTYKRENQLMFPSSSTDALISQLLVTGTRPQQIFRVPVVGS